jgi:hypothetical protein
MRSTCFQAKCLACGFTGLAMCASAQLDFWSSGSTSSDTFGGDPDSYGFIRIPSDTDDWTTHFRIGALVGMNISANFSERGNLNISGNNSAPGNFADGYVLPDQSGDTKYTSYWGYNNNANQYNPVGGSDGLGSLTMLSSTSFSAKSSSKDDGGPFPGFDMAYGDNLWYWKHARVGWELGFGMLPMTIKDNSSMSVAVNQSSYTFNTEGIVVPQTPQGGYQGGPSGQGPIISLSPSETPTSQPTAGIVTGTRQLDLMLYTVRFGPSFYWDLTDDFGMSLGAGPAIGIVSGNYQYNETITAGGVSVGNSGEFGKTGLTFGGYVNGTVLYHVISDADLYLSAFSSGGRQAQLNLGGQVYVSIGVNWAF